jgi:RHS repeat-associated protein
LPFSDHWNTPSSVLVDALSRTVESVERNGADPATWLRTRWEYDLRGNLLRVVDPLAREAFRYVYDLSDRPIRSENHDAGVRRLVLDAAGHEVERRDGKGALVLHNYDELQRPLRLWARDGTGQPLTLRERSVYGDQLGPAVPPDAAKAANLLGRLQQQYDEAGLLTFESFDFKGNVREKVRRVIRDAAVLSVFEPVPPGFVVQAFRVDWQLLPGKTLQDREADLLDPAEYRTSLTYDALNRVGRVRYPEDVGGGRKELRPRYNRAGALEQVELDGVTFVRHIAYNAKGQRTLLALGNGVLTRYALDAHTFRLARLRSEASTSPPGNPLTFQPGDPPNALQDFAYQYDLVGNLLALHDRTPAGGIPGSPAGAGALDRAFVYEPVYRLRSATGRECDGPPPPLPFEDAPLCHDVNRTRAFVEQYGYDAVGNLTQLSHEAGAGSFGRAFAFAPGSNRLASVSVGTDAADFTYDDNGNLTREGAVRHYEWDHSDRLKVYRTQADGDEPEVYAQSLYDPSGHRVKKLLRRRGGQVEVTVYVDGVFEHRRRIEADVVRENNLLHVLDDKQRIALVRVGEALPGDAAPAVQFPLGDHLGSSNVVVDDQGVFIDREEYTPFGESSFGGLGGKRYRFTGKERDEESGLCYHGARHYAPWLLRWISCDPLGLADGINRYVYAHDNPMTLVDGKGTQAETPTPLHATASPPPPLDSTLGTGATLGASQAGSVRPQEEDYARFLRTQPASLPWLFGPAHLQPYLIPQAGSISDPLLRSSTAIGERVNLAAASATQRTAAVVAGTLELGSVVAYTAPLAPYAGTTLGRAWQAVGTWVGAQFPRLTAVGLGVLGAETWQPTAVAPVSAPVVASEHGLIPAWRLVTPPITAPRITPSNYRGITQELRLWAREVANRYGYSGRVDVGHVVEHEFTAPGQTVLVRPLERSVNRAEGILIRAAAEARRAWNALHPAEPQLYTRH